MFVLMVAVLPPLLSDHPPELPQRAGLGDRFHYFRGLSGRRYLFSTVPREALADFSSAVAMLAAPAGRGRLAARAIVALDGKGRPAYGDGNWPPLMAPGTICLVHLLATSDQDRAAILDDLAGMPMRLAA
jgi:hypothetical protein